LDSNISEVEYRCEDATNFDRDVLDRVEPRFRDAAMEDAALVAINNSRIGDHECGPVPKPQHPECHDDGERKEEEKNTQPKRPTRHERDDEEEREKGTQDRKRCGRSIREDRSPNNGDHLLTVSKFEPFREIHIQ